MIVKHAHHKVRVMFVQEDFIWIAEWVSVCFVVIGACLVL